MAERDSDAKLVVADEGMVEGESRVAQEMIDGTVTGNGHTSKHVKMAAKAVVEGNVHYQLIEMVKGAQGNGSLVYSGSCATQKAESSSAATNAKKDNKMAGEPSGANT